MALINTTFLLAGLALCASSLRAQPADPFVQAQGNALMLNGSPFRFGGANSYVLMFSPNSVVDQILETTAGNHFTAVRMWAFDDVASSSDSFYLQSFAGGTPQYNDGANGLANVDYAVAKAGQLGLKLIIPFVNNWPDYGGMDRYVSARGLKYHDQFYEDATIRQWYKNWISHLLNHVNTISGIAYKDDPTIMIWELANEPRCQNTGLPSSTACTSQTIASWITDVSAYIKTIDSRHLISVGDEGFFCSANASGDYLENCSSGVDSMAFSQIAGIDIIGFHLYPEGWGRDVAWAENFIERHRAAADAVGKPVYMGEFGLVTGDIRNSVYYDWTNRVFMNGMSGGLFWDLVPGQPPPANAESQSGFDVKAGSPLLLTVGNFAQNMSANALSYFAPVAGDQWASGSYNTPVTLDPLGNAVAYPGAEIDPASIDLDPATPGQQTTFTAYGGVFQVVGQSVQFTPSSGFNGVTQCAYTVADTQQNASNTAYLIVTVSPSPAGASPETLESFEFGTDGWEALSGGGAAGSVSQTSAFHTDGNYGLEVNVASGGWFGTALPSPVDLSGRPSLSIDIKTPASGQSAIAFQSGPGSVWCQNATWPLVNAGTGTVTVSLDASQLQCFGGQPDFSSVSAIWVTLGGSGTYYLDNLHAAPLTAPKSGPPRPTIQGIANAASGQPGAASGAFLSIYGTNFAPAGSPAVTWSGWVVNGQLPASLAGVSVSIGGQAAYVYTVSPTQINVLAPRLPAGSLPVVVTTAAGSSDAFSVTAEALQPAFFLWGNYAVATHFPDYSLAVKNGTFSVNTVPAKPGDVIILWATGFGDTSPLAPIGREVPPGAYSITGVSVTVGNSPATVYGVALAPGLAGVYQVAIQVPLGLANGDYPVIASLNGVQSAAANLTVQQ